MPLGTGGALSLLKSRGLEKPLLVINGDLVTDFSVSDILRVHESKMNFITIGTRTYSHPIPFGCLQLKQDRVTSLVEKPVHRETINTGIYVISPSIFETISAEYLPITDVLAEAIRDGKRVGVFEIDDWIDVGVPEQLAQARGSI